jgi:membrane protein
VTGWNEGDVDLDIKRVDDTIRRAIWSERVDRLPRWKAVLIGLLRLLAVVLRDLVFGQLTLRAMGLVYTTLLSLVPLLAFSFSVLKAFGVHNQLQPMLQQFLLPLGVQGEEITGHILDFIENLNVGVLGAVGLAFLLYTAVSLVHKTEEAINHIWHVRQPRTFGERFSSYVTILLIGPVLVFTAIGVTATVTGSEQVQSILALEPVGRLFNLATRLVPYALVICAFTFAYMFLPNARVRVSAALAGGVTGGVLWQSAGWAFAGFVAASDRYEAIYASFAVLIFFLIWLYVSWLILLLGASVAFYLQNPQYVVLEAGEPRLSNRMRERLALLVMSRVAAAHVRGEPPWTRERLSHALRVPGHALDVVLDALRDGGLLAEGGGGQCWYLPACDLATVAVADMLAIVRAAGEERFLRPARLPMPEGLEDLVQRVDQATRAALERMTVRDLAFVAKCGQEPDAPPGSGQRTT